MKKKQRINKVSLFSVILGIVIWQIAFDLFVGKSLFLSSPIQVIKTFIELLNSGELIKHFNVSAVEFLYGYALSVVIGIPTGIFMASSRKINNYLDPWVSTFYSTPRIAFAPLIIIWFGIGLFSKSLIVFAGAIFPIILNTYTGVISVNQNYIEVVKSLGGNRWDLVKKVVIPDSIPAIITGLKLAIGRGIIGVVVAEWFGANAGLGYMIYFAAQTFNPSTIYVGIIIFVILGYLSFEILTIVQKWISPWAAIKFEMEPDV